MASLTPALPGLHVYTQQLTDAFKEYANQQMPLCDTRRDLGTNVVEVSFVDFHLVRKTEDEASSSPCYLRLTAKQSTKLQAAVKESRSLKKKFVDAIVQSFSALPTQILVRATVHPFFSTFLRGNNEHLQDLKKQHAIIDIIPQDKEQFLFTALGNSEDVGTEIHRFMEKLDTALSQQFQRYKQALLVILMTHVGLESEIFQGIYSARHDFLSYLQHVGEEEHVISEFNKIFEFHEQNNQTSIAEAATSLKR